MGKIGKPQKSKKQKRTKLTFDSGSKRDLNVPKRSSLKNLAPENEDVQEVPRKVRNIMKSQQELKRKKFNKRKKLKEKINIDEDFHMERGMSRPLKAAPRFVQGKKEKDHDFMKRVTLETQRVLMKSQIEDKYKIDLPESESEKALVKKKRSERKREKDRERKKKKAQTLKEKKLNRQGDFSEFRDEVKFGEVVMEPPDLTAKPRKANRLDENPKSGKRSLLLDDFIGDKLSKTKHSNESEPGGRVKIPVKRQEGKTVKRKFLLPAQQRVADSQRQRAIDLYRKIKNVKVKQR